MPESPPGTDERLTAHFADIAGERFSGVHFRELSRVLRFMEPEILQVHTRVRLNGLWPTLIGSSSPSLDDAYLFVEELQFDYEGFGNQRTRIQAYVDKAPALNPNGIQLASRRGTVRVPVQFIVPPGKQIEFWGVGGFDSPFGGLHELGMTHALQRRLAGGYGEHADPKILLDTSPGVSIPAAPGWESGNLGVSAFPQLGDYTLICLLDVTGGSGYTVAAEFAWAAETNVDNFGDHPAIPLPTGISGGVEKTIQVRPPKPGQQARIRISSSGGTAPTLDRVRLVQVHAQHDVEEPEYTPVLITVAGRKIPRDVYRDFGEVQP